MRSRGSEKVTVDRLLRLPPVHIDGKGLRAYRSLEQMAAKVSKEPDLAIVILCCARLQREKCGRSENCRAVRGEKTGHWCGSQHG